MLNIRNIHAECTMKKVQPLFSEHTVVRTLLNQLISNKQSINQSINQLRGSRHAAKHHMQLPGQLCMNGNVQHSQSSQKVCKKHNVIVIRVAPDVTSGPGQNPVIF